jgi:hypothetical protein
VVEEGHQWHLHHLEDQGRSQHGLISRGSHRGKNIETMQPRHFVGEKVDDQARFNMDQIIVIDGVSIWTNL